MKRFALALALGALSGNSAAGGGVAYENDEYIAYADPATVSRDGNLVQMSDLIDLKSPQSSPYGKPHASSTAHSEFDCQNSRVRTIAFSLHSGQMGDGDIVETVAESNRWLSVTPGTLLNVLWQLACSQT